VSSPVSAARRAKGGVGVVLEEDRPSEARAEQAAERYFVPARQVRRLIEHAFVEIDGARRRDADGQDRIEADAGRQDGRPCRLDQPIDDHVLAALSVGGPHVFGQHCAVRPDDDGPDLGSAEVDADDRRILGDDFAGPRVGHATTS
jgi:hypothetical protein